jgi:polyisoprenyl-teichoic acid--peptidoglycan teichoic acid transferase
MAPIDQRSAAPSDEAPLRPSRLDLEATGKFSRLDPEASGRFRSTRVAEPEKKHKVVEWILFAVFAVLAALAGLALYSAYSPEFNEVPNRVADGMKEDRINLLLIGVGGDKHPGGGKDLADALILASFKPSTKQVAVISVPRDLYVKIGRYGRHRLNTAHAIGGQSGYPGGGAALTMDTVSEVMGVPVHGFVRVDFAAFERIIDDLGGVDIEVQRPFYDFLFKDRFEAGPQHMNGKRALQYARYRYVIGPEGDNYAREMRQQQVIAAVQEKISKRSGEDVLRMMKALKTLSAHTDTNLTPTQMAWFYGNFRSIDQSHVRNVSLKPFMEKFELRTIADAGEAVRPKKGDFSDLHALSMSIFSDMRQIGTEDTIRIAKTPVAEESAMITGGS